MSTADPIRTQTLTYFLRPGDPAPARPATLYLALFTADPGMSGAATNELAASGYTRQPTAFDAPTDGETQDAAAVTFGPADSGGWPAITHVAVCAGDAAGTADLLFVGTLQTPVTLAPGQSLRVDAGQLTMAAGSASVDASGAVLAASGTRLFSYVVGDSLTGATISRASVATYRDANGVLQTATADIARDAHYIDGARTLLLEHAATNLLPYSEQLDNAAHGTFHGSFTPDVVTAPDGQQTADKFLEDTTNGWHGLNDANLVASFPDNTEGVLSCFAAPAGRSWMHNNISDKAVTHHEVWFDIGTGAVGQAQPGVLAPRISSYANGMWRVSFAASSGTGSRTSFADLVVGATTGDGIGSYTGNAADGIALWGVQFETGRYATSYIPNNGSGSASREGDLASWSYSLAPQESSGLVRFIELGAANDAGAGVLYIGNDQGTGPRLWIDVTGSGYRLVHDNGTGQVASAVAMAPAFGDSVALRWALYADGSVELFYSMNGGVETSGRRSAANAFAAAWGGQALRLNSVGTENVGLAAYTKCVVDAGVQSLATLDSPALPAEPSALSATANGTTVTLTWTDNSNNEDGFHIYRKYTSPDGTYTDANWVLVNPDTPVPANTNQFSDSGLTVGATYHYYVAAFSAAGESAPSNTVDITIPSGGGNAPAAPTGLTATPISAARVDLSWMNNATDATANEVHRSTTQGFAPDVSGGTTRVASLSATTTSYQDTTVAASTTYYYRVVMVNSAGNAPSSEASASTPAASGDSLAGRPNEPAGMTVMADRNFATLAQFAGDTSGSQGWLTDPEYKEGALQIVQDATAPHSPNTVLRFNFTPRTVSSGTSYSPGSVEHAFGQGQPLQTVYAALWFRLSPNYVKNGNAGGSSSVQKLMDVRFVTDANIRFSLTPFQVNDDGTTTFGKPFTIRPDYIDTALGFGEMSRVNNVNDVGALSFGEWHRAEAVAVLNSAPGVADGVYRLWLDSTLLADYRSCQFLPSLAGETSGSWQNVKADLVWGGTGGTITETFWIDYDHIYVSAAEARILP